MCGRILHHKITLKLLLIGLRRGCLKIIVFVDLHSELPPGNTPALTSELDDHTPKKERLRKKSSGEPGPGGFLNLNIFKLSLLRSFDSSLMGDWRLRPTFTSC